MQLPNETNSDIKLPVQAEETVASKNKNRQNIPSCVDTINEYEPYIFMSTIGNPVQTYVANIIVKLPAGYDLDMNNITISPGTFGTPASTELIYTINTKLSNPPCSGPVKHALQIPAANLVNINFLEILISDLQPTNVKAGTTVYKSGNTMPTKDRES